MMKKGFTIVESLVAIGILTTVIIGASSAVQSGISSYLFSKDQITAFYLAQEAMEQIRNLRDENRLNNRHWLYGISQNASNACYFGNACLVDPVNTPTPSVCSGGPGSCPVLRQDASTGFYGYSAGWAPTKFQRQIVLSSISEDEIVVTVTVNWSKGASNRQFKASASLLNRH